MALPLLLTPIINTLAEKGLSFVSKFVEQKADEGLAYVAEKTGIDFSAKEITVSPEQMIILRQLDDELKIKMRELDIEEKRVNLEQNKADTAVTINAQDMQKSALHQEDLFAKRYVYYLSSFWSLFAAVYIGVVTIIDIPQQNLRFVDTVLGFMLGTIVATIIQFFFGSSKGSKDAADKIHEMLKR